MMMVWLKAGCSSVSWHKERNPAAHKFCVSRCLSSKLQPATETNLSSSEGGWHCPRLSGYVSFSGMMSSSKCVEFCDIAYLIALCLYCNDCFPRKNRSASSLSLFFLHLFCKRIFRKVAVVFVGHIPFSPYQQCQALKQNSKHWPKPEKIIHWPQTFSIHGQTSNRKSAARFASASTRNSL